MGWADDLLTGVPDDPKASSQAGTSSPPTGDWTDQLLRGIPEPKYTQSATAAKPELEGWDRATGLIRNSVMEGLTSGFGQLGDLTHAVFGKYADLPPEYDLQGEAYGFPTTNQLRGLLAPTGVLNTEGLTPGKGAYPQTELMLTAAGRGMASSVPALMVGAPPVMTMVQGALGGMAGEAVREIAPNATGAQVAAGMMAGGLAQGAKNARAGDTFTRVANGLGSSRTAQEAGIELETAAKNWRENIFDQKISDAAAPLDQGIPGAAPTPGLELGNHIQELLDKGGQAANGIRGFLNDTERSGGDLGRIATTIKQSLATGKALGTPAAPPLTWEEGRMIRTEMGTALRSAKPDQRPALEYAYGGITKDLGTTANNFGLGDEFNNFNQVSTHLHQLDAGPIESILNAKQAADPVIRLWNSARKGGQEIEVLRNEMPDEINHVAAAHLSARPQDWNRLSPEGKFALVPDQSLISELNSAAANKQSKLVGGLERISGMQLGDLAGLAVAPLIPGAPELAVGAIGGLLGAGLPYVSKGFRSAIRPNMLGAEAVGGVAGGSERKK